MYLYLSEEVLQIVDKRREAKAKEKKKKKIYQLHAEFQRIARRDKKAVLNEQFKERGKQ